MTRELIAHLPTPLAVLLAGCCEGQAEWGRLFVLCETATHYLENALRAQAGYLKELDRPRAWGHRMATVRWLTKQLRAGGETPILELNTTADDALSRWIAARNRWAHSISPPSNEPPISGQDVPGLIAAVLTPLCRAELLLTLTTEAGTTRCALLQGLQGFFSPPHLITSAITWTGGQEPELFLRRDNEGVVRLTPYFRYRKGSGGENRVEFLSTLRASGVGDYHDALPG
jgi:hypothetical protein